MGASAAFSCLFPFRRSPRTHSFPKARFCRPLLAMLPAAPSWLAFPLAAPLTAQSSALHLDMQERVLDNGVTVLVRERPSAGRIGARVFYRVDVAAERPGTAGLTHMLAHHLFMGSFRGGPRTGMRSGPPPRPWSGSSARSPTSGTAAPRASSSAMSSPRSRCPARITGWIPPGSAGRCLRAANAPCQRDGLRLDPPAGGRWWWTRSAAPTIAPTALSSGSFVP